MKRIDMDSWERKKHYDFFRGLDYPHFNICANLDITAFYRFIKAEDYPFFASVLFAAVKTANLVKEFRYRIREDGVVEHDAVHPSFTVMTAQDVFSFCPVEYIDDFDLFIRNTKLAIEKTKSAVLLEDEPGRDDLLFISSLPWVSFTGITHPVHMHPVDSVPRITWGKFFEEYGGPEKGLRIKLPFSVQGHHALLDGAHMGQYFTTLQEILDNPYHKLRP